MSHRIINILWFQSIFLLSLRYQHQYIWLCLVLFLGHFLFTQNRVNELKITAVGLLAACLVDVTYAQLGVFEFSHQYGLAIPVWLILIWCAFACTLTRSLKFFRQRYWIAGIAAGISGPFCYWNGQRLGAVSFPLGNGETLVLLSLSWALVFPAMNWLINRVIDEDSSVNSLQSKSHSHYN